MNNSMNIRMNGNMNIRMNKSMNKKMNSSMNKRMNKHNKINRNKIIKTLIACYSNYPNNRMRLKILVFQDKLPSHKNMILHN